MHHAPSRLGRCLDRLSEIMMAFAMLLLAAMVILMNVEIIDRAVFKKSTMIADEYSGYFFTWIFLCALLYVQRSDGLLKVSLFTERLSPRLLRLSEILAALICGAVTALLSWTTLQTVLGSYEFNSTSLSTAETPLFIPQCIMPLGFALITLSLVETAVSRRQSRLRGQMAEQTGGLA